VCKESHKIIGKVIRQCHETENNKLHGAVFPEAKVMFKESCKQFKGNKLMS
jgi:hypothetical protein